MTNSLGINAQSLPESAARLMRDSGFKYVRREIPWGAIEYSEAGEPTRLKEANKQKIEADFRSMRNCGLRPLILLNANSGDPTPSRKFKVEVLQDAPPGATSVLVKNATGEEIVPGRTGFDELSFGGQPDILITSSAPIHPNEFKLTLSKPIPAHAEKGEGLTAGSMYTLTTLRYAPFERPTLENGSPNPVFEETLKGWLSYVATVSTLAREFFGPGGYDLEVWNELSFGSQFLDWENYYAPAGGEKNKKIAHEIKRDILKETVAYVRNPANGLSAGGITDGFASQTPFPSGGEAPLGLTALSKHPYAGPKRFPEEYRDNREPLNALRVRDTAGRKTKVPLFIPHYREYFPEFTLSGLTTDTLIRDLAPFPNNIQGTVHDRFTGPAGGEPLQRWITEYNLGIKDPERAEEPKEAVEEPVPEEEAAPTCEEKKKEIVCEEPEPSEGEVAEKEEKTKRIERPVGPDGVTEEFVKLTPADRMHFEAKVVLRSLVAMVSKGMDREYFFKGTPGALSLISDKFWEALEANAEAFPGDAAGGQAMEGLHNLLGQFQGGISASEVKPLTLHSIDQEGHHAQFAGDGTEAHPTQYDRDVLAVFPYQASATRYVIPVYVMTKDLLTLYEPPTGNGKEEPVVTNPTAFDLPEENFRVALSGFAANPICVKAYDPLRNADTPAKLVSQSAGEGVIEIEATDYPRLLMVESPC